MIARKAFLLAVATSISSAACASSSGGDDPAAFCEAFLDAQSDRLGPPLEALVPRDAEAARAALERDDTWLESTIDIAPAELVDEIEFYLSARRSLRDAVAEKWGEDGADLLADSERFGETIAQHVSVTGLETSTGTAGLDEITTRGAALSDEMSYRCHERPSDWMPVDELPTAEVPSTLRWLAIEPRDDGLVMTSNSTQGASADVVIPGEWRWVRNPVVSADGRWFAVQVDDGARTAAFVSRLDDVDDFVVIGEWGDVVRCLVFSDSSDLIAQATMTSPPWAPAVFDITAMIETGDDVDDATQQIGDPGECPAMLADGSVVAQHVDERTGQVEIRQAGDPSAPAFARLDQCSLFAPRPRPGSDEVAMLARCLNAYRSGLWLFGHDREPTQVLRGVIALPAWTPDGQWIVYGHVDHQLGAEPGRWPTLWASPADGSTAVRLSEREASWPAVVPPRAECAIC